MNDTPTIVISLIIGLVIGVVGTYFATDYLQKRDFQEVVTSNPSVMFDECEDLPAETQENCANDVLMRRALQNNDASLCESITAESQKDSCLTTLSYVDSLDTTADAYCASTVDRVLCLELMQFLAADAQQDAALCGDIASAELRTACASRLPINAEAQEAAQQELASNFGPICPQGSPATCETDAAAAKQAILAGNTEDCRNSGAFLDLCVRETELYALFTSAGESGCEGLPEVPTPRTEPGSIASQLTLEACRAELALAADASSGRFDYLQ